MTKFGFVIDQRKCIGCHACTVACKAENDVPLGAFRTWVKYVEKGEFPNSRRYFAVLRCNHCDNAPCVNICPTVALYTRPDGIVDFDPSRCIGCKSCMQACPYDALYIDPNTHTAAKCHYCAHRTEVGLQPACVIVCPEQAIIAGDMEDPTSEISRILGREQTVVRKPDQGTRPKLFYLGADAAALTPGVAYKPSTYMWAESQVQAPDRVLPVVSVPQNGAPSLIEPIGPNDSPGPLLLPPRAPPLAARTRSRFARVREVYDVFHPAPWGRKVSAYLWTKSVAAGALIVAALGGALEPAPMGQLNATVAPTLAVLFTLITTALLVFDLKRPERFLYILFKPNWRSWLVWGGWILLLYGGMSTLWLIGGLLGNQALVDLVRWPAFALGVAAAIYSAFLFGQAEGRDFWQSPLLAWQLAAAALLAGAAMLLLAARARGAPVDVRLLEVTLLIGVAATLLFVVAEVLTPHPNHDVAETARLLSCGPIAPVFWGVICGLGLALPLALLAIGLAVPSFAALGGAVAAVLALVGLYLYEDLWVRAGQSMPLS
ncbi:MAG TPA: 4Fe-4S dicluster domain-containing protein [Chloroflexota bacterium]|nr:4Fe-4S dicluster domain-containing protein [Chloroflexota bacterium]